MIILKSKHTVLQNQRAWNSAAAVIWSIKYIAAQPVLYFHGDDSRLGVVAAVCSAFTWLNIILSNT